MINVLRRVMPLAARRWIRQKQREAQIGLMPLRRVTNFDTLRRLTPISRDFGRDRGQSIDRYYIERFLAAHSRDIRGRILEMQNGVYTRQFGGDQVTQSDVLHAEEGNPLATIVADLSRADHIPSDIFDCIICTQTLLLIYDVRAAIRTLHRILKVGGVVLATVPGVSHKICRYDMDRGGDYWRFTSLSIRRLFEEAFLPGNVEVRAHGNVLAAIAFLHGLAVEELTKEEIDFEDPDFEVSITLRAVKHTPNP